MIGTLTWRAADGTETPFTAANGYQITKAPIGLDAPSPSNTVEDLIGFDGAALTNRRRTVRPILLPIHVTHPTRVQTRIAALAALIQGPGELEYSDGTNTRYLRNVVYEAGLAGDLSRGMPNWRNVIVSLLALDPWWYAAPQAASLPVATPTAFDAAIAFDATIPFDGGTSVTINVTGDIDALPTITVYGPATTVVVGAGGQEWQTASALTASDVLVVDTRPGVRGPRLNGGNVDWSLLTASSRLWTLPPGTQSVLVGTTGSTGATVISLEHSPRWLTP